MKCWKLAQRNSAKARCGHVMVTYKKSSIVWGGYCYGPYFREEKFLPGGETWFYHTDTEQWIHMGKQANHPPGTSGACAVVVNEGLYILFGHAGQLGSVNSVWRMDLTKANWEEVSVKEDILKPSPRDKCVAWVFQNKIYSFGGYGCPIDGYVHLHDNGDFLMDNDRSGDPLRGWNNQLVIFDPVEKCWTNPKCFGDIPSPRAAHAADLMQSNHKVYLFGGRSALKRLGDLYCFDSYTMKWERLYPSGGTPVGRSWHTFTAISPHYMFLYGGYTQDRQVLGDAWVLDVNTLQWTQTVSPSKTPRLWHSASVTSDNELLIFGGCCSDILDYEEETYHTSELLIIRIAPKSLKRLCLDAAFKNRKKLESEWEILPRSLSEVLKMRLHGMPQDTLCHGQTRRKNCTVS